MVLHDTVLNEQEKKWILDSCFTRKTDHKEVQIYPMGAERYLASVLLGDECRDFDILKEVKHKDILVIPGHGNSAFLLAQAGAKSVTVYDKDPITIAWVKAFKQYFHYRLPSGPTVGELLASLTRWYPPFISLPSGHISRFLSWVFLPNALRRTYIHYMISLVRHAIGQHIETGYELDKAISFHVGTIETIHQQTFDTAFVPYLLGVKQGIEHEREIVSFMKQLSSIVPHGHIMITPSQNIKEFYLAGTNYLKTIPYKNIQSIPLLAPHCILEDNNWFRTQGLCVFRSITATD